MPELFLINRLLVLISLLTNAFYLKNETESSVPLKLFRYVSFYLLAGIFLTSSEYKCFFFKFHHSLIPLTIQMEIYM